MNGIVDGVVRWSTQAKVSLLLFGGYVLIPFGLLIGSNVLEPREVTNGLVIYLALAIALFYPFSRAAGELVARISIKRINEYCRRIKQGKFDQIDRLPPERGDEHDFPRLERNLHWMGYALGVRERKLATALDGLEKAQKSVLESIEYASLIQRSALPRAESLRALLPDHFLWWSPRDAVGGDCYWVRPGTGGFFLGLVDCTGHGVPGAFMTLIATALFDRLDVEELAGTPGRALARLNGLIQDVLGKEVGGGSDDGLDAALVWIDADGKRLVFAGANRPLWIRRGEELREIRGDRWGVGYLKTPRDVTFADHALEPEAGEVFYLFTDGLVDQVGGAKGFPLGKKALRETLLACRTIPLAEQGERLMEMFETHRGDEARRDDVTVMGFTISPARRS